MKKIENYKNLIIYGFIFYVILFSFLLIKQNYKLDRKLKTNVTNNAQFEGLVSFDNFVNKKREILKSYEKINNKNISKECLTNISSELENVYFMNHNITTYGDLFSAYQYVYHTEKLDELVKVCGFSQNEASVLWNARFKKVYLTERELINVVGLYQITLSDVEFEEEKKYYDELSDKSDFNVLSEIRENDKLYIEKIFEILGEKYE